MYGCGFVENGGIFMKVISPLGKLLCVNKVVPIIETKINFNDTKRFLGEVVKEGVKANGLAFKCGSIINCDFSEELIIGNLPEEKVEDILSSLMIDGYCDLRMDYQKVDTMVTLQFGAEALPYTNEITFVGCKNYCDSLSCPNIFSACPLPDSEEEDEEDNE